MLVQPFYLAPWITFSCPDIVNVNDDESRQKVTWIGLSAAIVFDCAVKTNPGE